jgi:hypothetical protein
VGNSYVVKARVDCDVDKFKEYFALSTLFSVDCVVDWGS